MEQPAVSPSFVGIDISKERLDVHVLPATRAFSVPRDAKDLERLINDLRALSPALIVLEAMGGFEITVAAALASASLALAVVIRARSEILPVPPGGSPRRMRSMLASSLSLPSAFVRNHVRSPTLIARP